MPSLTSVIKQASRGADLYFVFRFLRLLTMKWTRTDAYKYKIIDKKGNALRKSSELESTNEKAAYTMLHRMVFKIRRLIEKVPLIGKSILLNYAAALFLLKEQKDTRIWTDEKYMTRKLMEFLETDWKADAEFLQEEIKNKYGKTSASEFLIEEVEIDELYKDYPGKGWVLGTKDEPKKLKDKDIVWRSKVHHWDNDVRSNNTRLIIVKNKGKFDMWAKSDKSGKIVFHFGTKPTLDAAKEFASIRKWQQKEEVEIDEAKMINVKLPAHLAKFFDKKGNPKPEVAARIRKARALKGVKITDVTPDWMFPNEEVELGPLQLATLKELEDVDVDEKKVPKIKFRTKQFKHLKPKKKSKSTTPSTGYTKYSDTTRGFHL